MKYLEALQGMSRTLAETSDFSAALSAVCAEVATLFSARYVHILTIHEGVDEHLRLITSDTASAQVYAPLKIKERYRQVVEMLMADSADPGTAIVINDATTSDVLPSDSRARLANLGGAHHAIVPLLAHGVLAGALGIVRGPEATPFAPGDAQVAEVVAALIAGAIVLRLRADELDRFFTTSLDLLSITSADGLALRLNPEWEQILGRPLDELIGTRLLDYVHPDDAAESVARLAALSSGDSVAAYTNRLRHADGSYRWLEWRAQSAGTLIYASARDITEALAHEHALRESEERYRLIADNVADVIWTVDLKGSQLTYMSPSVERLLGYTAAEILSRPHDASVTAESGRTSEDLILESVARFLRGESAPDTPIEFEIEQPHKDGRLVPVEIRARLLLDNEGRPSQLLGVSRDISERRAAEEALRRRIAELSALQRISATLAGSTDLLAVLPDVAAQLCSALRALHSVVFFFDEGIGGLHAVASDPTVAARCEALGARLPLQDLPEIAQVTASGKPLIISSADAPALTAPSLGCLTKEGTASLAILPLFVRGEIIGTLQLARETGRDPFSQRDLEVAETAGAAIAAAVGHERLRAEESRQAATAMRDRLARDLHDAVTQSVYAANLIAEALPSVWERDPAEGRAELLQLQRMVQTALAELRKLLHELRPATLAAADIGHLMERLVDALEGQTQAEITLEIQVHTTPPEEVKVAFYRIAQEAFNNIAKHSRATKIEARMLADSEGVVLSVRDNGVGFDPNDVPADHMGLAIIAERAAEIGADVELESAPGAGTQIIVSWPSSQEDRLQHEGGEATWPTNNASA